MSSIEGEKIGDCVIIDDDSDDCVIIKAPVLVGQVVTKKYPNRVTKKRPNQVAKKRQSWPVLIKVAQVMRDMTRALDGREPDAPVFDAAPTAPASSYDRVASAVLQHIQGWPGCTVVFLDVTGNVPDTDFSVNVFMLALYDSGRKFVVYGVGADHMGRYRAAAQNYAARIELVEHTFTVRDAVKRTAGLLAPRLVVSTSPDLPVAYVAAWAVAAKTSGFFRHRFPRDGRVVIVPHVASAAPLSKDEAFLEVDGRRYIENAMLFPYRRTEVEKIIARSQ